VLPTVRAEGIAELVGDLFLNCRGGAPTPAGQPIPLVTVQISVNTNVTSKLLDSGVSEATLHNWKAKFGGMDFSEAKRLRRGQVLAFFAGIPPCFVGLEACATAHHWARELIALGHETRLMPPSYVKAYVKRNKHDVADAEAICEAVRRPSMRFVPLKTAEQQSALMMHRARDLLIRQRTMLVNALRGHLAEFGLVEAQGLHKVARLIAIVMDWTGAYRILPVRC